MERIGIQFHEIIGEIRKEEPIDNCTGRQRRILCFPVEKALGEMILAAVFSDTL